MLEQLLASDPVPDGPRVSSTRSMRRATKATAAPSPESLRAIAAPIPLLEPVTNATVPSRRCAAIPLLSRNPDCQFSCWDENGHGTRNG
jgi:hypothetical protein